MDVKCPCQHCGQNIAFPVEAVGLETNCPHCGHSTRLAAAPAAPPVVAPVAAAPVLALPAEPKKTGPMAMGCAGFAGFVGLILLMAALGQLSESPQSAARREADNQKQQAFFAAEQFIKQRLPGAQKIAGFREAIVEQEGSTFRVAVQVDGLNAFGGPVRNVVGVEMELVGDKFVLKHLK